MPILQRQVNQELGEIGGVFVSKQPSDTDMGAKEPKTVLLKGIFYGKVRRALPWKTNLYRCGEPMKTHYIKCRSFNGEP